jgi:hypothetical protein
VTLLLAIPAPKPIKARTVSKVPASWTLRNGRQPNISSMRLAIEVAHPSSQVVGQSPHHQKGNERGWVIDDDGQRDVSAVLNPSSAR